MSDIRSQTINPPDLDDVLDELKNEIFANMNCVEIGKIEKYTKGEQTAEIKIQVKRRVDKNKTQEYPLLVDCPIFVLQGGGAFLDLPIEAGDNCVVFFNDRDIDNWWSGTGTIKEPNTTRKHSLSDGIAFVGVNTKNSVLNLDGTKVILNATNKTVEIKGNFLNIFGATESFVLGDVLETILTPLITAISSLIVTPPDTPVLRGDLANMQSSAVTLLGVLSTMKSIKIKGE